MKKDKVLPAAKQSMMDKYAQIGDSACALVAGGSVVNVLYNAVLLEAITQSQDMLDTKIGAVGSDVILLCQDLRRAMEWITEARDEGLRSLQMVVTKELAAWV
ncbi:hypothetical protein NDU88_001671 [Pleurodeles waltl]|uniref:Uncharacterized protein n=1 Tax=Pleurodeles waltl TaxID=8319 RepID=A0AAV7SZV1_PLEWA|nr:hypothetical protein NDU88_001671 [Pleurodeles waltl]